MIDDAGRVRGPVHRIFPVQLNWGGKLGVLAPSEMVIGLLRGTKSTSDMAARQPGEYAVPEVGRRRPDNGLVKDAGQVLNGAELRAAKFGKRGGRSGM